MYALVRAKFGAEYFDINSPLTLGEQIKNYLNNLGATIPQDEPNYNNLSNVDVEADRPTRTNHTTTPVYTEENP